MTFLVRGTAERKRKKLVLSVADAAFNAGNRLDLRASVRLV